LRRLRFRFVDFGLSVTFTIDGSSTARNDHRNTLTITGAGNLIIDANQVAAPTI